MIPFANETITLFHRTQGGIRRYVVRGCSYRRRSVRSVSDGMLTIATEATCRIPYDAQQPGEGDLIIPGEIQGAPGGGIEMTMLYEAHQAAGAFWVQSVADNGRCGYPAPHWAARGA